MNVKRWSLVVICLVVGLAAPAGEGLDAGAEGRPYRAYITSAARDGLPAPEVPGPAAAQLPPLPTGWPSQLALGHFDPPGGAPATAGAGFQFRYQYLAGGANTGTGWATWNPDGAFVSAYVEESRVANLTPVLVYYMVRQSLPGANQPEAAGVRANLESPATMRALYDDLELLFRRAAGRETVILHFEPDLWGYIQQLSSNDTATTVPIAVGSSGHEDLRGLPDDASGLALALFRLRDRYAPNVLIAYHLSLWGTGVDPLYADPGADELARVAERSVQFYLSLAAPFDVAFGEFSDRDAAFKQHVYGDGGASWWDEADFARHRDYLARFVAGSGLRFVLWQIPQGNTVMRSMNNTWNHYQDNKVEWLLGGQDYSRLQQYADAGIVALLFGRGADGATCACDAAGDGVTNPAPINGNSRSGTSPDDDGGYFTERLQAYVASGGLPLH